MQSSANRVLRQPGISKPVDDPERAYRQHLAAVARHDIEAILDGMTDEHARSLREMRRQRDFGPLFMPWCESQRDRLVIAGCQVEGDMANPITTKGPRHWYLLRMAPSCWPASPPATVAAPMASAWRV